MRWLLALPLLPLLLCGVFCVGGLVVAFVIGRASADRTPAERDTPEHENVS